MRTHEGCPLQTDATARLTSNETARPRSRPACAYYSERGIFYAPRSFLDIADTFKISFDPRFVRCWNNVMQFLNIKV